MKLLLAAAVICTFVALASTGVIVTQHQAFESGLVSCKNASAPGTLVVEELVHEKRHFFGRVERTIRIPETGFFPSPITCILVGDQRTDGSGGFVSIVEGGINQFLVTLHMTSKFGKGLDYRVQVYK